MSIRAIFFDLGDTLVESTGAPPPARLFRWLPGARDCLVDLRAKGLQIGLLSNTGNLDRPSLESMLPSDFDWDLFDPHAVVLSSEVGVEKPDLRIFRLALCRAQQHPDAQAAWNIGPGECLFCGEALPEILAAQQVGISSLWMGNSGRTAIGELLAHLSALDLFD
jgi:FMN phosphatase YigB (HAD superfamily)